MQKTALIHMDFGDIQIHLAKHRALHGLGNHRAVHQLIDLVAADAIGIDNLGGACRVQAFDGVPGAADGHHRKMWRNGLGGDNKKHIAGVIVEQGEQHIDIPADSHASQLIIILQIDLFHGKPLGNRLAHIRLAVIHHAYLLTTLGKLTRHFQAHWCGAHHNNIFPDITHSPSSSVPPSASDASASHCTGGRIPAACPRRGARNPPRD